MRSQSAISQFEWHHKNTSIESLTHFMHIKDCQVRSHEAASASILIGIGDWRPNPTRKTSLITVQFRAIDVLHAEKRRIVNEKHTKNTQPQHKKAKSDFLPICQMTIECKQHLKRHCF